MLKKKKRNRLQDSAFKLIKLLSDTSKVPFEDFGVHGSIALGMETDQSDIDLVVYGARNFRKLEVAVKKLTDEGALYYASNNRLDVEKRHHGHFGGKPFVYTAVRKTDEIAVKYGDYKYSPITPVKLHCRVIDDREAMFRPAVYEVSNCEPLNPTSQLENNQTPSTVVSMIAAYRNIARKDDYIEASGVLEQIEHLQTGRTCFQVVVGSGTSEDEYIWPVSD